MSSSSLKSRLANTNFGSLSPSTAKSAANGKNRKTMMNEEPSSCCETEKHHKISGGRLLVEAIIVFLIAAVIIWIILKITKPSYIYGLVDVNKIMTREWAFIIITSLIIAAIVVGVRSRRSH